MSEFYGAAQRQLQAQFGTTALADRLNQIIVTPSITDEHKDFIESRDFFFLATVDHRGFPSCSHKAGATGFVRVTEPGTLLFPSYDGNGMFLSMGNIRAQARVGLLFLDFETPHRVRVHGNARVAADDPLLAEFPGAQLLVRVAVAEVFVNCPRYIHVHRRVAPSPYTPRPGAPAVLPQWKRIDAVQDVIADSDRAAVRAAGGVIAPGEYHDMVRRGTG